MKIKCLNCGAENIVPDPTQEKKEKSVTGALASFPDKLSNNFSTRIITNI